MIPNEFLSEALNSEICPKNFSKIYEKFQVYQKKAWETLIEFARVCDKNAISYQLAYGSLLGAIRDGGQIPWDYDIDVFIPYEERGQLIEALNRDLKSEFMYYCPEIDKNCRHFIMRVAPKGFNTDSLHVDVFYMTGVAEEEEERKNQIAEIKRLALLRYYKLEDLSSIVKYSPKALPRVLLNKIKAKRYSLDDISYTYNEICMKYKSKESDYCVSADQFSDWYIFPKSIWNTTTISVSEVEFRIPADYQSILEMLYGDYSTVPPLANRIKELIYHLKKLESQNKSLIHGA